MKRSKKLRPVWKCHGSCHKLSLICPDPPAKPIPVPRGRLVKGTLFTFSKVEMEQHNRGSFATHMRQATCSLLFGGLFASCKHTVKYAAIIEAVRLFFFLDFQGALHILFLIKSTLDHNYVVLLSLALEGLNVGTLNMQLYNNVWGESHSRRPRSKVSNT